MTTELDKEQIKKNQTGEYLTSPEVTGRMQTASLCPFCGSRQSVGGGHIRIERRSKGSIWYFIRCWMCGAEGGRGETVAEAFDTWNRRPSRLWTPLPEASFTLPDKKWTTLMVLDDGATIRLIDWINDDIAAQVDVALGAFRISRLQPEKPASLREELNTMRARMGE